MNKAPSPAELHSGSLEMRARDIADTGLGGAQVLSTSQLREAVYKAALHHLRQAVAIERARHAKN